MEHRVPDKIYAAAAKVAPITEPDVGMVGVVDIDLFSQGVSPAPEVLSTGFLASLIRTRDEEAKAHRRYQLAVDEPEPDEGKIRVQQKTWQDLADHLRALEKAAPDVLKKSGDMWLSVDVVRELADIHAAIVNGVRSLGRRWALKAAAEWTVAQDRIFQAECDRLFSHLVESKFAAHE
ncbi:MAG: hypothetical protein WCS65_16110 [Verrucomicrobiae bacterium]